MLLGTVSLKLSGVEAARGIAALLVVMLHAEGAVSSPNDYGYVVFDGLMNFGRAGVDFFFVLSGFIISYVHTYDVGRPAAFPSFWRKRLLRIYPPWWAALALMGALLAISPTRELAERDPWHILASIFLLPENDVPILGVGWSLRHELLFYALFSLVLLHRRLGILVLAAWGVLIGFNALWATYDGAPYFTGLVDDLLFRVFNIQFFFGIAVAVLIRKYPVWRPKTLLLCGIALFFGNGMLESFGPAIQHEWPPRHLAYAAGAAMILYGLVALDRTKPLHVPTVLLELGAASYSIYLVHDLALLIMQQVLRRLRPVLNLPIEVAYLVLVVSAVATGMVFSRVVERRLLKFGHFATLRSVATPPKPVPGDE